MRTGRFWRFLGRADREKELYLAEIANGESDVVALERMNTTAGTEHTSATVRGWLREDPEFAAALRVARGGLPGPKVISMDRVLEEMARDGEIEHQRLRRRVWSSDQQPGVKEESELMRQWTASIPPPGSGL